MLDVSIPENQTIMMRWILRILVYAALLYSQGAAQATEGSLATTVKMLGADGENISDALDLLAEQPHQSVHLLLTELRPIPRKTYFDTAKKKKCLHVISCLRALHYLTGITFSATSVAKLTDDEKQFLDFRNTMHDENPGHALHFFGVWMSRNADIVAPADAQQNIIKQWRQWVSENGNSFKTPRAGHAAQSMDEWFWFG